MGTVHLFLSGIRGSGRHGASPGEREQAQEFVVDLDVEVETSSDELDRTADYRMLAKGARGTVENESFVLLETLAEAVAREALTHRGVVRATAVVHKPAATASLGIDGVAAAATVERDQRDGW